MQFMKGIILEAFGEISAIFMSQDIKGTEIIMPTEKLIKIAEETVAKLKENESK